MKSRSRIPTEFFLSAGFAVLFAATLVVPDWIEAVFGVDPDGGDSELEWAIVVVAGALSLLFAALGRFHWVRARRLSGAVS
jgi:hypothetical protein